MDSLQGIPVEYKLDRFPHVSMLLLLLKCRQWDVCTGRRCPAKETVFGSLPNFCCPEKEVWIELDRSSWLAKIMRRIKLRDKPKCLLLQGIWAVCTGTSKKSSNYSLYFRPKVHHRLNSSRQDCRFYSRDGLSICQVCTFLILDRKLPFRPVLLWSNSLHSKEMSAITENSTRW